jgi:hypothetical protein
MAVIIGSTEGIAVFAPNTGEGSTRAAIDEDALPFWKPVA